MKNINLFVNFFISILLIGLGFVYKSNLFNFESADFINNTYTWANVSIALGFVHLVITIFSLKFKKITFVLQMVNSILILVIQFPPIFFWFMFNNSFLDEHTQPVVKGIGHWYYSIPHVTIAIIAFLATFKLKPIIKEK